MPTTCAQWTLKYTTRRYIGLPRVHSGHLVVNLAFHKDDVSETSTYPLESVVVMLTRHRLDVRGILV